MPMVPLFRPVEAERERLEELHAKRTTPEHYGNGPGTNRSENPERSPGETYTVASYRRAIHRAVNKFNKQAKKPEERIEPFHPHALRHTALTRIRDLHGLEAAQAIGGHGSAAMTDRYTWRSSTLARTVAAQAG